MKHLSYATIALVLTVLAAPALAQVRGAMPFVSPYNSSITLSAPATSPIGAQMQDDYATQLSAEQRQLLQQNPSGSTRLELEIGHALNGFTPR